MQRIEQTLHKMLDTTRINCGREFFRVDLEVAIKVFSNWACSMRLIPEKGIDFLDYGEIALMHSDVLTHGAPPVNGLTPLDRFNVLKKGGDFDWEWSRHESMVLRKRRQERLEQLGLGGVQ